MNKIELVLFLLIIGSSAIGWIVRKLKEQANVRQHQMGLERQRLDALRTGRNLETLQGAPGASPTLLGAESSPAPARPMTAEERLREIMMERQRRLEELKRRAQAQAQTKSQTQSQSRAQRPQAPTPAQARAQARIDQARAAQAQATQNRAAQIRAAQAARPQARPQAAQRPTQSSRGITLNTSDGAYTDEKQRREQIARKRAEAEREGAIARNQQDNYERGERERTDRERAAATIADSARRASPVPAGPRIAGITSTPVIAGAAGLSSAELRRAIVMNEILSPPRSMREDL